jgi:hypothetical protein
MGTQSGAGEDEEEARLASEVAAAEAERGELAPRQQQQQQQPSMSDTELVGAVEDATRPSRAAEVSPAEDVGAERNTLHVSTAFEPAGMFDEEEEHAGPADAPTPMGTARVFDRVSGERHHRRRWPDLVSASLAWLTPRRALARRGAGAARRARSRGARCADRDRATRPLPDRTVRAPTARRVSLAATAWPSARRRSAVQGLWHRRGIHAVDEPAWLAPCALHRGARAVAPRHLSRWWLGFSLGGVLGSCHAAEQRDGPGGQTEGAPAVGIVQLQGPDNMFPTWCAQSQSRFLSLPTAKQGGRTEDDAGRPLHAACGARTDGPA